MELSVNDDWLKFIVVDWTNGLFDSFPIVAWLSKAFDEGLYWLIGGCGAVDGWFWECWLLPNCGITGWVGVWERVKGDMEWGEADWDTWLCWGVAVKLGVKAGLGEERCCWTEDIDEGGIWAAWGPEGFDW